MIPSAPAPEQIQPGLPIGDGLRLRREQLGWSLPDIAGWLHIKLAYLQALEDGRPQELPGSAYALGFLRSYGAILGLDPEELANRFHQETKGLDRRQALSFPAPVPERGVPAGAALLIGVVLVGVTYTGWYMFGGHETVPLRSVPPLPANLAPYAGDPLHPAAAPREAMPPPSPPASPAPAAPPPAASSAPPSAAAPEPQPTAEGPVVQPMPAVPPTTAAPAPPPGPVVVTLKALASSWVQVREVGGPVIYDRVLQPGETWPVPSGNGSLVMSTGNAGGITLSAGDVTTPILGPPGAVRRNLPLSADAIRDGSLLARAEAQRPASQQDPISRQTGQSPPFLAGSGHRTTLPASNDGQSHPEH